MKPSLARIVHFIGGDNEHRAAIITKVWSDTCVNLFVFPTGSNYDPEPVQTSVVHYDDSRTWSWHWPERVE